MDWHALFQEFRDTPRAQVRDCQHERTEFRRRTYVDGRLARVEQCMTCGKSLGARKGAKHGIEDFDHELGKSYAIRRSESYADMKADRTEEWFEIYNEYLKSPKWADIRRLVHLRSSGRCEGCMIRPGTQVHHHTYERVGNELLFDLSHVCDSCHERAHDDR